MLPRLGLLLRTGLRMSSVTQLQPCRSRWHNLVELHVRSWKDLDVIGTDLEMVRTLLSEMKLVISVRSWWLVLRSAHGYPVCENYIFIR